MIFLAKGTSVQPRLRGANFVNIYGFLEDSGVIPHKSAYMDDENWAKVSKVVSPSIRKMRVRNVAYVFPILFSI